MNPTEKEQFLKEFGIRVRKLRLKTGLSQEALANLIGYTSDNSRSSINKIEAGKSDLPASKIHALAKALGVSIGCLMGWYDEFDKEFDTKRLQAEVNIIEQIENSYDKTVSDAFTMFIRLDQADQGEIRGEMKQMLKSEKYSVQEGSSNGKAM